VEIKEDPRLKTPKWQALTPTMTSFYYQGQQQDLIIKAILKSCINKDLVDSSASSN
jgi:hypothetical protein